MLLESHVDDVIVFLHASAPGAGHCRWWIASAVSRWGRSKMQGHGSCLGFGNSATVMAPWKLTLW